MKALRDISPKSSIKDDKKLEGVKKSSVEDGKVSNPDYMNDHDKETVNFAKKHKIEKHEDRVGNDGDLYNAKNIKYSLDDPKNKNYGHKKDEDKKVYEAKECNHSESGKTCPVHGDQNCSKTKSVKEVLKKKNEKEDGGIPNKFPAFGVDGGPVGI